MSKDHHSSCLKKSFRRIQICWLIVIRAGLYQTKIKWPRAAMATRNDSGASSRQQSINHDRLCMEWKQRGCYDDAIAYIEKPSHFLKYVQAKVMGRLFVVIYASALSVFVCVLAGSDNEVFVCVNKLNN